jgi:hypothetical protein
MMKRDQEGYIVDKDNIESLIQDLNRILNQVIRDNRELKNIIQKIHSLGYNVQISFNMGEGEAGAVARTNDASGEESKVQLNLSKDDYLFLKSIKISVDD